MKSAEETKNSVWVIHRQGLTVYEPALNMTLELMYSPKGDWLQSLKKEVEGNQ